MDHHHQHMHPRPRPPAAAPAPASAPARSNGSAAIRATARASSILAPPRSPAAPSPAPPCPGPAGTARRQPPGTRCAAPHAGRSHQPAPPPAPRRPAPRPAAAPPGCCRPRSGPPAGAMNHSRCWANDNGTRSGRSRGRQRQPRRARLLQPRRQPGRGRRLEQRPHRQLRAQHRPHPADQPHRQQRMPAQGEEVIIRPDPVHARARRRTPPHRISSPTVGRRPAAAAPPRSPGRAARPGPPSRSASAAARPAPPPPTGTMYSGSRPAAYSRTARRQPAAPVAVAAGRRGPRRRPAAGPPGASSRAVTTACATPGQRGQHRLDLTGLDPEPADLHLVIGPPGEHQLPVRAVHRARSPVRYIRSPPAPNGHATNRSAVSPGPAQVPARQPRTRHIQLPGHPRRHRAPATRSSTNTRVLATGDPIGTCPAPPIQRRPTTSRHTVVSVGPYELNITRPGRPPPPSPPAGHASPAVTTTIRRPHQPLIQRPPAPPQRQRHMRHPRLRQEPRQLPAQPPPRRHHHQHRPDSSAMHHSHPNVSKLADANCSHPVPGRHPDQPRLRRRQARQPRMRHHHALRHARSTPTYRSRTPDVARQPPPSGRHHRRHRRTRPPRRPGRPARSPAPARHRHASGAIGPAPRMTAGPGVGQHVRRSAPPDTPDPPAGTPRRPSAPPAAPPPAPADRSIITATTGSGPAPRPPAPAPAGSPAPSSSP